MPCQIPPTLDALTSTSARRPDQAAHINALNPLVRNKLDELRRTIELRQNAGLEAALAVRTDRGKAVMDQIRQVCSEIQMVAYGRLAQYSEESRASANELRFAGTFGCIGNFVLLLISSITIQRGTHRREQLIQDLQQSEAQTAESRDLLLTTIGCIGDGAIATDAAGELPS